MKELVPILTITGSDSTGGAGVQADIRTISALGGYALSVVTSVTVQNTQGIHAMHDLPADIVVGQMNAIMDDVRPKAIKVGMVRDVESIRRLAKEVVACSRVVCDPGLVSSRGERLVGDEVVDALRRWGLPRVMVLTLKCSEAEVLLGHGVESVEEMVTAARELTAMGPEAVLMQGMHGADKVLTDVLVMEGRNEVVYFSSPDMEGWQLHGVGGTLSSAVATYLGQGDEVEVAVKKAHDYIQNLVVYWLRETKESVASMRGGYGGSLLHRAQTPTVSSRQVELYNQLMALIAEHYREARDVAFYAAKMHVTTKYLSQVTRKIRDKSPKQVIADYLMREVERDLAVTSQTVQEVAYAYGFESQALFCKFFKNQRGCSPTEFRNRQAMLNI
ncbi:MAG: bifunctional hydroxymethylpyrimidine kinase/phosphomethylpyrimidine kinase [Bacteroidaceae bacterium]|nr:bifunctional hydroxymethylpyrimidine kinase/phosphomethylpyrimidine kinase [Bacteroidaceae bacterium]